MDWTSAQLRSLVELTRRGTITAVADVLGYTPGGVSQQLSALERAAGTPLLRRAGRRVELTDAGSALAMHAERMLGIEADAVAALERATRTVSGVLHVGLFATAAAEILPLALARAQDEHPGLTVRSREMVVDEVYDSDTAASLALVEAGVGVTPVTDLMLRLRPSRFRVLALTERFERHIVVIVRAAAQRRPTVAALISVLREVTGGE